MYNSIKQQFEIAYQKMNNRDYVWNEETTNYFYTLLHFMSKNERFKKSPLINDYSTPDMNKGLLVVGTVGTGKSSTIKALKMVLRFTDANFSFYTTNECVDYYKQVSKGGPEDMKVFWHRHEAKEVWYDDLMAERQVVDYGERFELIENILFRRAEKQLLTNAIMNYDNNYPLDCYKAIESLKSRYGFRVADRIFQMFNIIELKGESFRL